MPKHDTDTTYLDRMREAWDRRQARNTNATPKSLYDTTKALRQALFDETLNGNFTEGKMLKARSKRFAETNQLIGNTVFKFNKDGLTQVIDAGYARYDYEALLKLNGVSAVHDEVEVLKGKEKVQDAKLDEPKKAEIQNKPSEHEASGSKAKLSDKPGKEAKEAKESEK